MTQRYGTLSLAGAGAAVVLAQTFHPMMLVILRAGQSAAWLAAMLAGAVALVMLLPAALWLQARPGTDLIDLARSAAGSPGALVTALFVAGILVYHAGVLIRLTSEMAVTSVYPHTPQTFAMTGLLACVVAGAIMPAAGLVRLCYLLLPFLVLGIAGILLGSLGWGEFRFILPFWGPGPGLLLIRSVGVSSFFVPMMLFLLMGTRFANGSRHLVRAAAVAIGGATCLLALVNALLAITFPPPLGYHISYPLHQMSRLIVGGRFFERVDVLVLLLWVLSTAAHLSVAVQTGARAYARAFGMADYRHAVLPLILLTGVTALFPTDQAEGLAFRAAYFDVAWAGTAGLLLLLTGLAVLRGRWQRRAA